MKIPPIIVDKTGECVLDDTLEKHDGRSASSDIARSSRGSGNKDTRVHPSILMPAPTFTQELAHLTLTCENASETAVSILRL